MQTSGGPIPNHPTIQSQRCGTSFVSSGSPAVIPHVFTPPAVIPDTFNPLAVIPDVFNLPLSFPTFLSGIQGFPMQAHTNKGKGTEEKDTGFPLTTGGHDKGGRRA